ncbi:type VII secretion-associated serine protease [Sphaerisporangium melleum]|uniref:Type VII secretion-associated serine protease n=1 Tax=Sphaerisporangium melleum TaxID=321316 RepID=A0A917RJA9_9ACTN|nr:S8 family serine peptidase [Sphaerisporangium melleum]GGL08815.1 type VII secretion-associated serine protease [Sphaerisporangium melleum]GII68784.1 type VII secretion-associated serine protease [Sphaerisporangium melleum]
MLRAAGVLGAALALTGLLAGPPAVAQDVRGRQQWVLDAVKAEQAWRTSRGAGVTVAVVDSVVDEATRELKGKVTVAPDMRSTLFDEVPLARGPHGTAMASLIAGSGKEGGLIGVAPESRILSVPVIDESEPEDDFVEPDDGLGPPAESPLSRALRYATDHGAQVISMSLGEYATQRADRQAVAYALARGVVLVAAVGNDGDSESALRRGTSFWSFPAGYPGVIGVGAVDKNGRPAAFSSDNLSVLVGAPGVGVTAAVPGGGYQEVEGSSASTALVAGVAALIKARYPHLPPELVSRAISSTARGGSPAGYDDKRGFGVVDAAAALTRAGELVAYQGSTAVRGDLHFGNGATAPAPTPPGPDPLRLWVYGAGVLFGLVAFGAAVIVLTRRAERQ